jgi:hypothetical protein
MIWQLPVAPRPHSTEGSSGNSDGWQGFLTALSLDSVFLQRSDPYAAIMASE